MRDKIIKKKKDHWNTFYKKMIIISESSFSRFVIRWLKLRKFNIIERNLVDIGCGNSRDSVYFTKKRLKVTGIDQSFTAIKFNKKKFQNVDYFKKDICAKNFNLNLKKFDYLYARFFIHAISEKHETQFLLNCKKISKKNSLFLFEFRTTLDSLMQKGTKLKGNERFFGHYRRFIDIDQFLKKIKLHGFKMLYISQGKNYANFKKEQPHICRIIFKKSN